MKPTSINITSKLKQFSTGVEYNLSCAVDGSIPDTDIRWTKSGHSFERGMVCIYFLVIYYIIHILNKLILVIQRIYAHNVNVSLFYSIFFFIVKYFHTIKIIKRKIRAVRTALIF